MNYKRIFASFTLYMSALTAPSFILAQDQADDATEGDSEELVLEEVIVTGSMRASLANSILAKRDSDNLIETIFADDIGKLPDQNLAEVMENIPGVQITRTAGVGTGVQIRGTNANRTEINGVSTAGSGTGRTGISFEDVSASIIAGVEVVKTPEAKTIEGSVGGTINLKTIRPLNLPEMLIAARVQGEDSSLSTDGITPRVSGSFGNVWDTKYGEFGAVFSGSYAEQDVTAFRPRVDRDNFVAKGGNPSAPDFDHLPIQYLNQDYDNYETKTTNFVGSLEWAPNEDLMFYFDAVVGNQDGNQESSRVQVSGPSSVTKTAKVTEFELVDFGTLDGINGPQDLGSIMAAVRGILPAQTASPWDSNLRMSGDTNSRDTDSNIYSFGGKWDRDRFRASYEISTSKSETYTPSINTVLNFINPNAPFGSPNDNGTPVEFDLTGGSLTFGVAQGDARAPTKEQLLDPANYRLNDVNITDDYLKNKEEAVRLDFNYDLSHSSSDVGLDLDFGYRYNDTSSLRDEAATNYGVRTMKDAAPGNLFASILVPGPDNFNDADGRDLYFPDFLLVDAEQVQDDPEGVIAALNAAQAAWHAITGSTRGGISAPSSTTSAYFDISEKTNALYTQANMSWRMLRGNIGMRYLETDVVSTGLQAINGVPTPTDTKGSYDFYLPRINLVADLSETWILRTAWGKDIRRPDFDDLSTSFTFSTSANPPVELGNPNLKPEEVESFDIGLEWYFAPASVVSVGYFHKDRTGLFSRRESDPVEDANGYRDITDPCEEGGMFNPIASPNVFAPPGTPNGVCVPTSMWVNGSGTATQQGIEFVFTYDLAQFENSLGWASGFGFTGNYTWQKFDGADEYLSAQSRATTVFKALGATEVVTMRQPLIDLSENAYNLTVYYERYNFSARMRYIWREGYRSTDFGSTTSYPWGFPVFQEDRSQLNASLSYTFLENWTVAVEGVNLTEEDVVQSCVNEGALLCWQGLTDRRITFGIAYKY